MSVAPIEPTPPVEPAVVPVEPAAVTPPWGDNFDAETAWNLVQNLRSDKEKLSAREILTPEQKTKLDEYDRLEAASKTELEKAQDAASKATERITSMTQRAVAAEVKALAAATFADPADASAFLDLAKYANADGEIDTAAIAADLSSLIEKKPHLAKPAGPVDPRAPRPNPAQGASGSGSGSPKSQLAQSDLSRMTSDEIVAAKAEGRLNDLLGIT